MLGTPGSYMGVSSSVNISGALWWIPFTTVHSVFFIRKLFYRPRLNIPIFLPILGWKYSCNILNYSLWHVILFGLDACLVSRSVSRYIVQGQDVTSDDAWRWGKRVKTMEQRLKTFDRCQVQTKWQNSTPFVFFYLTQNRLFTLFQT